MKSFALLFLIACGSSTATPAKPDPNAQQTGPADKCAHDSDCFCRVFDGAHFQPGKEPSKCCTGGACTDPLGATVPAYHCMKCVYD